MNINIALKRNNKEKERKEEEEEETKQRTSHIEKGKKNILSDGASLQSSHST